MAHSEHQYEPDEYQPSELRPRPAARPDVVYYAFAYEQPGGHLQSVGLLSSGLIRVLETVPASNPDYQRIGTWNPVIVQFNKGGGPFILYRWQYIKKLWQKVKP